jgi:glycosyltransferase involved in cell wall biosynthesis
MNVFPKEQPAVKQTRKTAPRVSIVIPSYNHERFVARAIESVLAQTYQDFEIVITDDASTDGSVSVLMAYARKDPRITLFLNHLNYETQAANHCIQHAAGEYIAVLCSDDEFYPTKLEKQVDFLDQNPEFAAVFTQVRIIDEEGRNFPDPSNPYYTIFQQPNRSRHEWLRHFFFMGNCLCHSSVLIRRSAYDALGLYNPLMGALDDLDMWVRICLHHEIHILPNTLVNFTVRNHHQNASADTPENVRRAHYETIKILDHFQSPQAFAQLHLIFPQLAAETLNEADAIKRHALAMAALKDGGPAHRLWAIDLLYQLLSDPEVKLQLRHRIGEAPELDFIRLNGALNQITFEPRFITQIFWAEGGAYSEVNSNSRFGRRSQWSEVRFPLRAWDAEAPLRLDPCDCAGVVRISGLKVVSEADGRCLWSCALNTSEETVKLAGTAIWLSRGQDAMSILSTGNDPQIHMFGITSLPDVPLELRVWIKLEPGLAGVAEEMETLRARRSKLDDLVEDLKAESERLTAERDVFMAASERLTADRDVFMAAAAERDHAAKLILSSRSWRYTRPLRSLRRIFGSRRTVESPER